MFCGRRGGADPPASSSWGTRSGPHPRPPPFPPVGTSGTGRELCAEAGSGPQAVARAAAISRGPSPPRAVLCPSSAHPRLPVPEWTISGGVWGVAWDQEHSRVEAAPPRAHRAILRLLKTTGHVMPRAALHIGRWSPCSPVRGDSPLLVCGAVPPADSPDAGSFSKQAGQHLALGIHRGLQGPVNLLLRWFRFRGQRAGGVLCRGPLPRRGRAGLRGVCVAPSAECPPRATGPHGARGGSPRPCLPGLGTCRPGPPQARRLVTSSAPPAPSGAHTCQTPQPVEHGVSVCTQ